MGTTTKIAWADHTFNPWIGCSRVHAGCQHCYAEAMAGRLGVVWGLNGTRRRTAESTWKHVERWNRKAAPGICTCPGLGSKPPHLWPCPAVPDRPRVFPSLCDPFEDWQHGVSCGDSLLENMSVTRRDFFALIDRCQNLDFLLLTKRPENVRRMWVEKERPAGDKPDQDRRQNVWLLFSASDQSSLDAGLPHLLACRDLAPVLGLSLEPLIGPVDLHDAFRVGTEGGWEWEGAKRQMISWVVAGGESGPHYRPMEIDWLRSIADQCAATVIPLFVKQDSGPRAGQQGRISAELWALKQFPGKDA